MSPARACATRSEWRSADALRGEQVFVDQPAEQVTPAHTIGIACAAHGPAEIVRDGESGWLVPPDDQPALEQALVEAASQPDERRRRGQQAAAQAAHCYGWAAIAAQVADVYEQAAAQHSQAAEAQTRRERARG